MQRVRAAVIGTGFIGPVHVEALRRISSLVEVTALAGRTDESARAAARELNIPFSTGDYRDLLSRDDVDAVHVCTPNYLHYEMVRECLDRGKHVLCEKPLALTSDEARELVGLAAKKGLKAAVNYNLRYYPMVREMRERNGLHSGDEVFALQGAYLQDWLFHSDDYSWRLESRESGKTRAIADIGTHWMDLAQYISGLKIVRVMARFARMHETRSKRRDGTSHTFSGGDSGDDGGRVSYSVDTEDYAQLLLEFENGVPGNLTVSQVSAGYKNFMEFRQTGRSGSFEWNSESPNRLFIGRRDGANEILSKDPGLLSRGAAGLSSFPGGHQEGYGETMKNLFGDFYADILGRSGESADGAYPTLADGLAEMALCEAILRSAETGEWVEVEA